MSKAGCPLSTEGGTWERVAPSSSPGNFVMLFVEMLYSGAFCALLNEV